MQKFKLKLLAPLFFVSGSCSAIIENQQIQMDQQGDCVTTKRINVYDKAFQSMRSIVGTLNKSLQDFFSSKNNESTIVHREKFKKIQMRINEVVEELKIIANDHPVLLEVIAHADSIRNQFKTFVLIVDEFKLQKPSHAMAFANKLQSSIDVEKLFTDLITKLEKLQTKYETKDKNFSDHLSGFIRSLRAVVHQWSVKEKDRNKYKMEMFQNITMRMSRK